MTAPHIPALRRGRAYQSLEQTNILDCRSGQVLASLSQVNAGIVRKDLARVSEGREALKKLPVARLLDICAQAGALFLDGTLPLGGGTEQSASQYVEALSASSGLPHVLVRRNMAKIHAALTNMRAILDGLTRGLDREVLDHGFGGRLSFYPVSQSLGVVMPSNSPAVNSLWLPAVALKIPVVIKPGREEPWTPYRLIQAFIAAGCPPEAFGFYPSDHEGAGEILRGCGRALIFGDTNTTAPYAGNPAIQIHGPGYSKILVGEDQIERWPEFIDLMASAVSDNGGRSCINASAILVPRCAEEIAGALARKLGPVAPLPADDENARLAAFANPKMADFIDNAIEEGLQTPGARDVTAACRGGPRKTRFEGAVYVRPTIVLCDSFSHPLANREFLCPYASVVTSPQSEMLEKIGPSLAVTAITREAAFIGQLVESPLIQRLNIGPISTMTVSWDQPHEGNLFEFLYKRRALEIAQ
jgi:acyl-CoA reductase-like NAD-dependent aldehyde dehydrogenase